MRTDVKVGLALGALFLIVAVSYYGTKKSDDTLDLADGSVQDTAQDMSKVDQVVQNTPPASPKSRKRPAAKTTKRPTPQTQARRPQRKTPGQRQNTPATRPQPPTSQPDSDVAADTEPAVAAQPPVGNRLPQNFRAVDSRQAAAEQPQVPRREQRIPPRVNERPLTTAQSQRTPRQPRRTVNPPGEVAAAPSPAVQRSTREAAAKTHIVASGDSFSTLAEKYYGSQSYTQRLVQANPDVDPRRMQIGTVLRVPPLGSPSEPEARPTASTRTRAPRSATATQYVVASGDTLYDIASRKLGDGARWREIHEINGSVIGTDPHALKVGMVLDLPK